MIRVMVVDDHALLCSGLQALLSRYADLQVVAQAHQGAEALEQLALVPVDVVVLDVLMPGTDGLDVVREVRVRYPHVQVLGLSMLTCPQQVAELFQAGFHGYVLKSANIGELVAGIRSVAAGRTFLCTEMGAACLQQVMARAQQHAAPGRDSAERPYATGAVATSQTLTRREVEVLRLVAAGYTTDEIATRLFTSKRTVETHRQRLIAKTQARNTAALVRYALRQGLV